MEFGSYLFFLIISLGASVIGAICGIGGGVIIKPILDVCGVAGVATISFLSSCTVLSMSAYSVLKGVIGKTQRVDPKVDLPLALSAAVGGIVGKWLFSTLKACFTDESIVGGWQAVVLGVLTLGTLLYTANKEKIRTKRIESIPLCLVLGFLLGVFSSFLGIGGGPFNLIVLFYFFSMDTKKAVGSSLYVILFSQIASLAVTLLEGSVPSFEWPALALMVIGGISGGIIGRRINRKISAETVDKLFMGLLVVIVLICVFNTIRFWN